MKLEWVSFERFTFGFVFIPTWALHVMIGWGAVVLTWREI